jgi:hypothetical protein
MTAGFQRSSGSGKKNNRKKIAHLKMNELEMKKKSISGFIRIDSEFKNRRKRQKQV